jgi:hypothetical protein
MNAQIPISTNGANDPSLVTDPQEVMTLTPELLSIVAGGEGMICIG